MKKKRTLAHYFNMNKLSLFIAIFLLISVALFVIFIQNNNSEKIEYTIAHTSPETLVVENLRIEQKKDTYVLTGRLTNNSDIDITLLNSRLTCTINEQELRQAVVIGQTYNKARGRMEPENIAVGDRYVFAIPLEHQAYANDTCVLEVLNWSRYEEN